MKDISEEFGDVLFASLEFMSFTFVIVIGFILLWAIVTFFIDINQTTHAIRRNYPVIGRFRYMFEHVGEFFRQYFFAQDREELPFNRAQRSWAYRAAKNINNTVAFGSTRDLRQPGNVCFVNCPFPTLGEDGVPPRLITIGPQCEKPFTTSSIFNISGMSYGALSKVAVLALSHGAKQSGIWMNTGEGGVSEYHLKGGCDIVFQIGTAKNGVSDLDGNLSDEKLTKTSAHSQVKMFEIKMSQGAKPGKGGILPAAKVSAEIAEIRGIREGEAAISPNRHPDISSNEDLLHMIYRIRKVTGKPVGFKTVVGSVDMLDSLFTSITKLGIEYAPDFITVDGADGGSGAAPMPLMDTVGLPLRESLPMLVDKLKQYDLRDQVKVVASGKLINPSDVAWAICLGADFVTNARGFMFSLGCIQALQCNKNTCPTGITTHNPKLQRGLHWETKSNRVAYYAQNMVKEVGMIAHSCGVKSAQDLNRKHARVVQSNGLSVGLDELHPGYKN